MTLNQYIFFLEINEIDIRGAGTDFDFRHISERGRKEDNSRIFGQANWESEWIPQCPIQRAKTRFESDLPDLQVKHFVRLAISNRISLQIVSKGKLFLLFTW